MNWIEIILVLVVIAAFVGVARRLFGRQLLQLFYAMARMPCHAPRYRDGVAKLMPQFMVEPQRHTRCTLWKLHDGPHEGTTKGGELERWDDSV